MSHLLELRNRLLKAVLALFVAFIPCAIFANDLFAFIAQPLIDKLPEGSTLHHHQRGRPVHDAVQGGVLRGGVRRDARDAVPDLGFRARRACTARKSASRCRCWSSSVLLFYAAWCSRTYLVFPVMFTVPVGTTPTGRDVHARYRQPTSTSCSPCSSPSAWPSKCRSPWCCWCSPASSASRSSATTAAT